MLKGYSRKLIQQYGFIVALSHNQGLRFLLRNGNKFCLMHSLEYFSPWEDQPPFPILLRISMKKAGWKEAGELVAMHLKETTTPHVYGWSPFNMDKAWGNKCLKYLQKCIKKGL